MVASPDPQNTDQPAHRAYQELLSQVRSLVLATTNFDGSPLVSYTPFIVNEQRQFFIFTSRLAAHTRNLQRTGQASINRGVRSRMLVTVSSFRIDSMIWLTANSCPLTMPTVWTMKRFYPLPPMT